MSKHTNNLQAFGKQLQEKRLASNYDFEYLASLFNEIVGGVGEFTPAELEQWENGDCDLSNPRIFAAAQFFGIDLNGILKDVKVQATKGRK